MIQTRSHIKESLFNSSDLYSTSSDYLSSSYLFPSPPKLSHQLQITEINMSNRMRFRKSSTSLQSSQTLKSKKSFSSQTRSKLQQSAVLKKVLTKTIHDDTILLKQKQESIETYKKKVRDLKNKKARLGQQIQNIQLNQLRKCNNLRNKINQYFNKI